MFGEASVPEVVPCVAVNESSWDWPGTVLGAGKVPVEEEGAGQPPSSLWEGRELLTKVKDFNVCTSRQQVYLCCVSVCTEKNCNFRQLVNEMIVSKTNQIYTSAYTTQDVLRMFHMMAIVNPQSTHKSCLFYGVNYSYNYFVNNPFDWIRVTPLSFNIVGLNWAIFGQQSSWLRYNNY